MKAQIVHDRFFAALAHAMCKAGHAMQYGGTVADAELLRVGLGTDGLALAREVYQAVGNVDGGVDPAKFALNREAVVQWLEEWLKVFRAARKAAHKAEAKAVFDAKMAAKDKQDAEVRALVGSGFRVTTSATIDAAVGRGT